MEEKELKNFLEKVSIICNNERKASKTPGLMAGIIH